MARGDRESAISATDVARVPRRVSLGDVAAGQKAMVRELWGGREFSQRVAALGFTPGAEVTVIQNYGRGPMIVSVRGCQVALGRGEASKIVVEAS
jgi:ferrous iron transport protein A